MIRIDHSCNAAVKFDYSRVVPYLVEQSMSGRTKRHEFNDWRCNYYCQPVKDESEHVRSVTR